MDVTHSKRGWGKGGSHSARLPWFDNKVHDHLGVQCALWLTGAQWCRFR